MKEFFKEFELVSINSNDYSIPHILNISIVGVKPETFLHALEQYDIYISTKSACSTSDISSAVYDITHDKNKALSSLRISLSYLTSKEEIEIFKEAFSKCYKELTTLR